MLDKLSDISNNARKTKCPLGVHSWMSELLSFRGHQKEVGRLFTGRRPAARQCASDGDMEVSPFWF